MRHLDVAGGTGDIAFRVIDAARLSERQAGLAPQVGRRPRAPQAGVRTCPPLRVPLAR